MTTGVGDCAVLCCAVRCAVCVCALCWATEVVVCCTLLANDGPTPVVSVCNWKLALDLWVSFQRAAQESFPIRASVLLSGEEECWSCWPCRLAAESGGSCESLEILELFSSYYCPARIAPTRPDLGF